MRETRPKTLPKLLGGDTELSNFITCKEPRRSTTAADTHQDARRAARLLLCQVPGVPATLTRYNSYAPSSWNPQDVGRRFLANGGSGYIDLDHLEICTPEVLSARDYVAAQHAGYRIANAAREQAQLDLAPDETLHVLANTSDGKGHSYGAHTSFLITRDLWEDIVHRRPHYAGFLATYLTTAMIFTGAGKVGSENQRPAVDYQISQRADFMCVTLAEQTTFTRPIINTRDESHADDVGSARLHLINFDCGLAHTALYLKAGVTQLILAMMEQGRLNPALQLDHPVVATHWFSHHPDLNARAPFIGGKSWTALDAQKRFLTLARRFVDSGAAEGVVPEAETIITEWGAVLDELTRRDWDSLSTKLDWVLKSRLIERYREKHGCSATSPQVRHLDQVYASVDPRSGLYFACEANGHAKTLVHEEEILQRMETPPRNTRAWVRARLLQKIHHSDVVSVDWNEIQYYLDNERWVLDLDDPTLQLTEMERNALEDAPDMTVACDVLGLQPRQWCSSSWNSNA